MYISEVFLDLTLLEYPITGTLDYAKNKGDKLKKLKDQLDYLSTMMAKTTGKQHDFFEKLYIQTKEQYEKTKRIKTHLALRKAS